MSNNTSEEIKKLEEQLKQLKQKEQIEQENKQLKEDVAYLRKSQENRVKGQTYGCLGCAGLFIIIGTLFMLIMCISI